MPRRSNVKSQVKVLATQGLRDHEIAELLGVGRDYVGTIRRKFGLRKWYQQSFDEANSEFIAGQFRLGIPDRCVAKKLGVKLSSLRYFRYRLGLKHPRGKAELANTRRN